jgi:hypothetical protein
MFNRSAACSFLPENISEDECVSSSLSKINRNFQKLEQTVQTLEDRISVNQIRTFFYYGPNSATNASSGMQDNNPSRPSSLTIQSYVNDLTQLALPRISKTGDIAYVIYQKTGYFSTLGQPFEGIPSRFDQTTFARTDVVNYYLPTFITWKLTFNGIAYLVDVGFPKFSTALASATPAQPGNTLWNQPQRWSTF